MRRAQHLNPTPDSNPSLILNLHANPSAIAAFSRWQDPTVVVDFEFRMMKARQVSCEAEADDRGVVVAAFGSLLSATPDTMLVVARALAALQQVTVLTLICVNIALDSGL